MATDLKDILSIFNNTTSNYPHCFYGIYSRLGLAFSATDGKLQLKFAKALDPSANKGGKKEKGEEVYDNKNQKYFTLTNAECNHIFTNYKKVLDGSYVYKPLKSTEKVNEKYKNSIQLKHYSTDATSTLAVAQHLDKNGKAVGIKVTLLTGDKDSTIAFVLSGSELSIFIKFVENGAYNSPVVFQYFKMFIKHLKTAIFEAMKEDPNKNGKTTNNTKINKPKKEVEEEESISDDFETKDDSSSNSEVEDSEPDEEEVPW